jgi:hypothetical protein
MINRVWEKVIGNAIQKVMGIEKGEEDTKYKNRT